MERVLQFVVFVVRLGLWILLEADDQVWNRFWKRGEIASEAFFVARPGVVEEVHQELFSAFLVFRKLPYCGAIGDVRERGDAVRAEQWRLELNFFREIGLLRFRQSEQADGVGGAGGLASQHGFHIARRAP